MVEPAVGVEPFRVLVSSIVLMHGPHQHEDYAPLRDKVLVIYVVYM